MIQLTRGATLAFPNWEFLSSGAITNAISKMIYVDYNSNDIDFQDTSNLESYTALANVTNEIFINHYQSSDLEIRLEIELEDNSIFTETIIWSSDTQEFSYLQPNVDIGTTFRFITNFEDDDDNVNIISSEGGSVTYALIDDHNLDNTYGETSTQVLKYGKTIGWDHCNNSTK